MPEYEDTDLAALLQIAVKSFVEMSERVKRRERYQARLDRMVAVLVRQDAVVFALLVPTLREQQKARISPESVVDLATKLLDHIDDAVYGIDAEFEEEGEVMTSAPAVTSDEAPPTSEV